MRGEGGPLRLVIPGDDPLVGYLTLPGHPGDGVPGAVARTVRLRSLVDYVGPDVVLDLDADGRLIGIEIVG